jgi:RNA recognition motif-containing protein
MNIYIGNLSYQTTENELQQAFEAYGNVESVSIIKDKFTGQSRGFGFVEMSNDSEGRAAIEALDGQEIGGRNMKVNEARPKEDRKGSDRRPQRRDRRSPRRDNRS